ETRSIEPFAQGVLARLGAASLVRAVETVSVVLEVDSRLAEAIHYANPESGGGLFDYRQLPIPQNRVGCAVPGTAESLALTEGQFVNHAGGEIVIEIDLR